GLANGYPVSAVAGKAEIMRLMEEIFFSFTFGGETLSLAAALAAMTKLQKEPVIKTLWSQGLKVTDGVKSLIEKHGLQDVLSIGGKECWSFLLFRDTDVCSQWELKTLFLQEVFSRGILTLGSHNMSYAHSDGDIERLLQAYNEVFAIIKEVLVKGNLKAWLKTDPLVPLFRIR
ncbi:MAG: aspartate aminotransferase family protein, partial [Nitrospirota bacterium]|nr:aspartate aminotransferase family protein [Nitrospirota bacterium]